MSDLTPDQQANGYLQLGSTVVNPTGQSNGQGGSVVGNVTRYTGSNPTMGTGATTPPPVSTPTPVTTPTTPNPPADSSYPGTTNPVLDLFKNLPTSYPTPEDESNIRTGIANSMQGAVDAVNKNYNDLLSTNIIPAAQQNSGATRAAVGRAGLLGSDYGNSQQQKASDRNQTVEDQAQAERETKLNDITDQINSRAQDEINARKAAALGNTEQLAQYTQSAQTAARQNIQDLASIGAVLTPEMKASLLKDSGYDPMTFDAVFNANREHSQQAQYEYVNMGNGTVLRTGKTASGQALPNQTFQYQLGPNDEFQVTQNGTPVIVTKNGNQITDVKVAPGFQAGSLGSKYTPVYSNGNMSILNTLTGQISGTNTGSDQLSGGGGSSSLNSTSTLQDLFNVWAPSSDGNDPTSYASTVAKQLGIDSSTPLSQLAGQVPQLADAITQHENMNQNYPELNNPGALKFAGQPGATMGKNGFAQFATPDAGRQALINDLNAKIGAASSNTQASGGSKPFDPTDPTDALAATYLQGSAIPKGNGKSTASAGTVTARANEIATQLGLVQPGEAFDQTALKADQKTAMATLLQQVPQKAQLQANLDAADSNFNMLTQFMQQHGLNASNVPLANQLQQLINSGGLKGADATAAQAAMNSALAGLKTEYSQILARGGQRNEAIDREADKLIPGTLSPAELQMVVNYIKSEGQNVLKSKDTAIANAQKSFSNFSSSSSSASSTGTTSSGIQYSITP